MKLKRLLLIFQLLILFTNNIAFSTNFGETKTQKIKRITLNEIKVGRSSLYKYIKNKEYDKVIELEKRLFSSIDTTKFLVICPLEQCVLDIITCQFRFVKKPKFFYSNIEANNKDKIRPKYDYFYYLIEQLLINNKKRIFEIAKDSLNDESQYDFLKIFITYILNRKHEHQDELRKKGLIYLEKYPESEFNKFIEDYICFKYQTSKYNLGTSLLYIVKFQKEPFDQYLANTLRDPGFDVSMDFFINKMVLSLDYDWNMKSTLDSGTKIENDTVYSGSKVHIDILTLNIGYQFKLNNYLYLTPFIGFGLANIEFVNKGLVFSNNTGTIDTYCPTFVFGLNIDVKSVFKGRKVDLLFSEKRKYSFWNFRIQPGMHISKYSKYLINPGFYLKIGFGGIKPLFVNKD